MERRKGLISRTLDAVQGRFRRARPGSVLIMVVSLLVLLALIGTAAMSTTRLDRQSSAQHVKNVQVDILATSVREMVVALLVRDLTQGAAGNQIDSAISPPVVDIPGAETQDAILGSRIPERMMRVLKDIAPGVREDPMNHNPSSGREVQAPTQDEIVWNSPSYPPVMNGPNNTFRLDLPNEPTDDLQKASFYQLVLPKPRFVPTTLQLKPGGPTYPALLAFDEYGKPKDSIQVINSATGQPTPIPLRIGGASSTGAFLAADADGDGVADSLLFKLPMAPISGITYYGAVRVIDNAAAINVNTAWTANADVANVKTKGVPGAANPQPWINGAISLAGAHPGSIDLNGLLHPTDTPDPIKNPGEPPLTEMQQVNGQRLFGQRDQGGRTTVATMYQPYGPPGLPSSAVSTTIMDPISERFWNPYTPTDNPGPNYKFRDMIQRTEYLFVTPNDAMDKQLGRRLDYPGPWAPKSTTARVDVREDWDFWGNGVRPFGIGDSIALAYRFTIMNPDAHDSLIERALFRSTVLNVKQSGKYQPTGDQATAQVQVKKWFVDNFDYPWVVVQGGAAPTPLRFGYDEGAAPPADYPSDPLPLRALLTTLNPVRNSVDPMELPAAQTAFFQPRYMVNVNGSLPVPIGAGNPKPFWDQELRLVDRDDDSLLNFILRVPSAPKTKVNVNTAGFADLWRSFMNVMAATAKSSPFDFGKFDPIYRGNRFGPAPTFTSVGNEEHLARMFRSPLRPVGVENAAGAEDFRGALRMHPYQVMVLRSAIAALNTQALRNDLDVKDPADPTRHIISDRMIPFADILLPQVSPDYDPVLYPPANTTAFYAGLGATVYGVKRQPFITEVLMSNNVETLPANPAQRQQNASGFVAIEIHNPYDRPMDVSGWKLSVIDRRPVGGVADPSDPEQNLGRTRVQWVNTATSAGQPVLRQVDLPSNTYAPAARWDPTAGTPEGDAAANAPGGADGQGSERFRFPPDTFIPPGGHLVVTNTPVDPATVTTLPANDLDTARYTPAGIDMNTLYARAVNRTGAPHNDIYQQGGLALAYSKYLHYAIGHEVVLSRPVVAYEDAGTGMANQIEHKLRWAPVDSFDATGLKHQVFDAGVAVADREVLTRQWHYARSSDPAAGRAWNFVYPGRYDASKIYTQAPTVPDDRMHHQGIQSVGWAPTTTQTPDPWSVATGGPITPITLGALNPRNSRDNTAQYPTAVSTFPIQIANTDFTAHFDDARLTMATNPTGGFPTNPMHGFLRTGDIQHVTYIGSYTIWDAGQWKYDPTMPSQAQDFKNRVPQPPYAYDPNNPTFSQPPSDDDPTLPPTRKTLALNPRFIEVNSLPMDAAFAEDTDVTDDRNPWDEGLAAGAPIRPLEDIGRFAPLNVARRDVGAAAPYFFADLQAQQYTGVTKDADVGNGTTTFFETENAFSSRNLRLQYPNDFWNGYEVLVFNDNPVAGETWRVQHAYVATFTKSAGNPARAQIDLVGPGFLDQLQARDTSNNPRQYTFVLQRVRYGWATKLHEYFTTTRSPADDYSPNVDPDPFLERAWGGVLREAANSTPPQPYIPYPVPNLYPTKNVRDPNHAVNRPAPVAPGSPSTLPEDDVPAEGLININTASWRVLAQLPLVMREDDPTKVDHVATEYLARQIVYFRDIDDGKGFDPNDPAYANPATRMFKPRPHGPFKSLFELLLIPEFEASRTPAASNPYVAPAPNATAPPRNLLPTQNPNRDGFVDRLDYDPSAVDGDFSPLINPAAPPNQRGDGVRWDWKEKYLMLNRISNLITTKSDCYTAYIQVQGWRDAGTADATLVSQKRLAFIVDRSRIYGNKRNPTVYNVPVAE